MGNRQVLQEGSGREVIREGGHVYRRAGWWTPDVHALLSHLEAAGFPYAPRVVGCDDEREILTFIPGDSGPDAWIKVVSEDGLARFARLLRAYHDAVRTFVPPVGAAWSFSEGAPAAGEIICHNDFGPWNTVWDGNEPVGILDWDLAGPAPALDDVAYALEYTAPFRDDETAIRWLRYERPPDRRRRIQVFAEAYGLPDAAGLVDRVISRQRLTLAHVRILAARGLEPQATWVAEGYLGALEARAAWSEAHRSLCE